MKVLPTNTKRNEELAEDYKAGMVMHQINAKYNLSTTRIYKILDNYDVPRRGRKK